MISSFAVAMAALTCAYDATEWVFMRLEVRKEILRAAGAVRSWRAAGGMFGGLRRPRQGLRSQPCVARRAWGIGAVSLAGIGQSDLASDARCHAK